MLSPEVVAALDSAGPNRVELEKVLANYGAPEDSLKFKAACFLIGNMEGHSYVTYALQDTTSHEIPFEPLSFATYDSLESAFGVLERSYGSLDFKKKDLTEDLSSITADFLIENIDYAFKAWQERPWARWLSFDQFCQFVLPYRGSNEPLDPWRKNLFNQYAPIQGSLPDSTNPVAAARAINNDLLSWFKFDSRYYYHPTDQGLTEMLAAKKGRCEDMTNLTIYAMRANGLAVTSDYTPYWSDTSNNHAWNAILLPDGKAIPFMGAEVNPGDYTLPHKAAKVYRKTFENHPENLTFQPRKQKKIPGWLAGKSYIDVTSDYMKTCDVAVDLTEPVPDSIDIAYLCIFNTGEWQPIQWGRISGQSVVFSAMGTGIAYLPAYYINEKIVPAGLPFICGDDCATTILKPTHGDVATVQLVSVARTKPTTDVGGKITSHLTAGKQYELFYWDGGWKSHGSATANDQPLMFENVPSGCLYRLVAADSDKEERIFTLNGVLQVWW
jgi:hypothetical protein